VAATVNPGVLQASLLKDISSQALRKKRGLPKNKEWSSNHFFVLSDMKVGMITFLIPGSGSCLLSMRSKDGNKLQCGVSIDTTARQRRMKWAFEVTCGTTGTRIDDNQDSRSALDQSKGHTSHLKSQ
jgi:hypothetical protein